MNRPIKFRAWDGECMYVFNLATLIAGSSTLQKVLSNENVAPDGVPNVMQFTGLHDKNGKEIYEGDVLLVSDEYTDVITDDGRGPTEPYNHLARVSYENGAFGVEIMEKGNAFNAGFYTFPLLENEYVNANELEILGNVYESPELISRP